MRYAAVVILLWASPLFAAQRTFVASNGLDTNPCTHDQPCRSFNAAIAATTTGGEVVALDSAGYGTATIAVAITIVGAPGVHAGISVFSGNGIEVNAGSGDSVVLRNLSITGLGGTRGVNVTGVGALHVENCIVAGFTDFGIFANVTGAGI